MSSVSNCVLVTTADVPGDVQGREGSCADYHTPHKPAVGRYGLSCHLLDSLIPLVVIFDTLTASVRWQHSTAGYVTVLLRHSELNFQRDNARPSRTDMNCPWPAWSPDFSPTEHIWDAMKIDDLFQLLEKIWHKIIQDTT